MFSDLNKHVAVSCTQAVISEGSKQLQFLQNEGKIVHGFFSYGKGITNVLHHR